MMEGWQVIVRPIHWKVDCMRAQECKEAGVAAKEAGAEPRLIS